MSPRLSWAHVCGITAGQRELNTKDIFRQAEITARTLKQHEECVGKFYKC